jgi:hypothetical protein
MSRNVRFGALLVGLLVAPGVARAGWLVQWQETAIKNNGDRLDPQPSTVRISRGKVRIAQTATTSLLDYGKGTFAILNNGQGYFWSGTLDDYLSQMTKDRSQGLHQRLGPQADDMNFEQPKVDPSTLPPVAIEKTEEAATIAGHATTKYLVKVEGELLQELWLAEGLDVSRDLDVKRFLDFERKMSGAMLGASADAFNAVYRSDDYRKLLERGYILKSVTHHIAGSYERVATEIRQEEVPAAEFEVPDSYRRVRLSDVFPAAEG